MHYIIQNISALATMAQSMGFTQIHQLAETKADIRTFSTYNAR